MVSGWRGYVWAPKKSDAFRDSASDGLQTSIVVKEIYIFFILFSHTIQHVSPYHVNELSFFFLYIFIYKKYQIARCICQQRLMAERLLQGNIARTNCTKKEIRFECSN
jgi:hypothetical protein